MSGFELVAGVICVFFISGIAVGVLVVIALPRLRRPRRGVRYMNGGDWQEPPALRRDPDDRARWPDPRA